MTREYARVRLNMAEDPAYLDLTVDAQHLYANILLIDPSLSYCGIADWRPVRLTQRAADLTLDRIMAAAAVLEQARFALFDPDTEEVLVRTLVRNDELLRNPKMALSVVKAYQGTASRTLRAIVASELHKARETQAEFSSWTHPLSKDALGRLLELPTLDPADYTNRITNPITNRNTNHIGNDIGNADEVPNANRITNTDPGADYQSDSVDFLPVASNQQTYSQQPESSYVGTEGNDASANKPPPLHCPRHINEPTTSPCHACGEARRNRQAWDREQSDAQLFAISEEARRRAEIKAVAIEACEICNEHGYVGTTVCDHDSERFARNRRGIDLVNETLAKKRAEAAAKESDDE
ncbi:hypothetical protein R4P64_07820 [Rhodococcus sp. IEGM 1366]|uniref:hypothetical protein n=1 Tax=Rhodococcus sp. IEGM 1366 TaxID=3082223 RepID=UPI0029543B9C|nr:hypothetical protein [Rhodococcus sp. IEGM 1366]MDV8066408.1 hypothetical protein [Rhodococcus sp. IEGM 1366]